MDFHAIAVYPIFLMQLYPHYISCANHLRMQSKHTRYASACIPHFPMSNKMHSVLCFVAVRYCFHRWLRILLSNVPAQYLYDLASRISYTGARLARARDQRNGNHSPVPQERGPRASIARGDKKMIYVPRVCDSAREIPWRGSRGATADPIDDAERSSARCEVSAKLPTSLHDLAIVL